MKSIILMLTVTVDHLTCIRDFDFGVQVETGTVIGTMETVK